MMMKPTLIALAALTAFDAIVSGGRYRTEVINAITSLVHWILGMGWSMTIT